MGSIPIVKPNWITDSINEKKLLDYKRYLLYTNQSKTQPRLDFAKPSTSKCDQTNEEPRNKSTLTAADPKFLEEFYSNSRLHLISTLGAEFKQLVKQMRERTNKDFPGKETLIKKYGESNSCMFLYYC